ncbi:hypothetical protein [Paenibacillus qinlingensis]|uniref:hypothetical protein n=1 Tax=Paenibacillus qinlingensis TaxID=1837343 RepID=UPI001566EDD5|nr:hypothetical protein [Paenibacillus qinlingensis]NQX60366.1 hypothetical protein [Paenibacillus qinlingensis]
MQFPKEYRQLIIQTMDKNGWIELPAQGTSMYPYIKMGDICRFVPAQADHIKKGDVVLFLTRYGSLVAHRLLRKAVLEQGFILHCKGDTNLACDEGIDQELLIGRMDWIQRNERIIHVDGWAAQAWGYIVLGVPSISFVLNYYVARRKRAQG